jgi:GalNAc-alpha-(1->4)-GalNAc-alpha-(1->3)-diNAcBac-PP-undecaprenol alpha-1,4-N-acetyl-D-galactosaminyltransferase
MKKILFLMSSMGAGGAERVAATLANAWVSRGDRVTLMPTFSARGDCFYPLSRQVELVYLADLVSNNKWTYASRIARLLAMRRFVKMDRPAVIVSFLSNVNVAAVLASAGLRIPLIVCERVDPFVLPMSPFQWLACRIAYPFADVLMVQTHAVAFKYASSGWALRRVSVIPNPIPEQMLSIPVHSAVARTRRLLSIGRLDEQKQFNVLIKVFASLKGRNPNWSLRIVGEGPLRVALQQQIVALGMETCIELFGRSSDIGQELAEADAFVLTSKYEGFPNALLEAMAAGLPCIAFDCPSGPQEMSLDGRVALLVPLNDERALEHELERLMVNDDLRRSLGERARTSVRERFSLDRVLERWDSLFEELGVLN